MLDNEFEKKAHKHITRVISILNESKIKKEKGFDLRFRKVEDFESKVEKFKKIKEEAYKNRKKGELSISLKYYHEALKYLEEIYTPIKYLRCIPYHLWDDVSRIYITNDFLHEGLIAKRTAYLYLKSIEPIADACNQITFENEIYWTTKAVSDKLSKEEHFLEALKYETERLLYLTRDYETAKGSGIKENKTLVRMRECYLSTAFTLNKLGRKKEAEKYLEEFDLLGKIIKCDYLTQKERREDERYRGISKDLRSFISMKEIKKGHAE